MSENSTPAVPPMIRQRELIDQIAPRLPERVEGEWLKLEFTHRKLSMYGEGHMDVMFADGSTGSALPPRDVLKLDGELRDVMYQADVGTWFSVTWTMSKSDSGEVSTQVHFNYDDEPNWDSPIDPGLYGIDLEDFPRSDENIPEWLHTLLAEAEKRAK